MNKVVLKSAKEVEEWFTPRKQVYSFDFETTGLDYMTMAWVGISFYDGEQACYIDMDQNANREDIANILSVVFQSGLWIAHNVKFDMKCCRKFIGVDPEKVFCTYIASYLLDENRPTHGLKVLAAQDLKVPISEIQGWETAKNYGYHSEEWYRYCHNDAIWAYQLYELYKPQLTEEGLDHVFYNIEMPFVYVCADMEVNGVKVDQDELKSLERKTANKLIELEDRMAASAGLEIYIQNKMFGLEPERVMSKNLRSPDQLKKVIKKLGFNVKDTKKQTIEKLKGKHPFIDLLLDYKKLRKLYDAYILPTFDMVDSDGRIRPSFGIVKTGRTNCRSPNLQQLPNLSKSHPDLNYRALFIAENDSKLVGGDYSGQELRCLGVVSGDETIIDSFNNNYDLHLVTANYIFNLQLSDDNLRLGSKENEEAVKTYKTERYKAKNGVNFPIVYGSSEYGISHNMGVSVDVAKEWRTKFFELYPRVKEAMNETRKELEANLEVSTMMGRKRRFPLYKVLPNYSKGKTPSKSRCVRQAFNFKIQGFSADQIKIASAIARTLGLKILLIIHDEIVIEVSRNMDVRTAVLLLKQAMEGAVNLSIPFVVDVKVGNRYSELK